MFRTKRGKRYYIKMIARDTGERFVSGTFKTFRAARHFADNLDEGAWNWELVG